VVIITQSDTKEYIRRKSNVFYLKSDHLSSAGSYCRNAWRVCKSILCSGW